MPNVKHRPSIPRDIDPTAGLVATTALAMTLNIKGPLKNSRERRSHAQEELPLYAPRTMQEK